MIDKFLFFGIKLYLKNVIISTVYVREIKIDKKLREEIIKIQLFYKILQLINHSCDLVKLSC